MKTFKELEQLAYMSNLPKIAAVYAQLDDNEVAEYEIERLYAKIDDLEFDCEYYEQKVLWLEDKIEQFEDKLEKIKDICNE